MATELSVTELARNFSEYIDRVVFRGERYVITRANKPVAEIVPVPAGGRLGDLAGLLASLPRLSPEEAREFGSDVDDARDALDELPHVYPWTPA